MRRIAIIGIMLVSLAMQAQDYARLAERTILGTARYMGMSGAMTAIGGDPSAVQDNPAGLGLYRRAEVLVTGDLGIDKTTGTKSTLRFSLAQASVVFSLGTGNEEKGLIAHNLMFSYQRRRTFARTLYGTAPYGASLGGFLASEGIKMNIKYPNHLIHDGNRFSFDERGSIHEFGLDWAMNYSNQWYAGLGLRIHSYGLTEDALYQEDFAVDTSYLDNKTYVSHRGVGVSLAAGAIYRPLSWLRIGFGIQTPSLGSLRTYSSATTESGMDSIYTSWAPDISEPDNNFHLPLRLTSSVAFQIGAYGMVAVQYDYSHATYQNDRHTFRVGLEAIPVMGLYINAGYAYENDFVKGDRPAAIDPPFERRDTYSQFTHGVHYASCAVGYRGSAMIVQMAYQYRWQKINLYAHPTAADYDIKAETHRIVLTIGWHR